MTHKQTDYSRRLRSSIPAIGWLLLLGFGLLIPIGAYGFTTHGYVGLNACTSKMDTKNGMAVRRNIPKRVPDNAFGVAAVKAVTTMAAIAGKQQTSMAMTAASKPT